MILIAPSRLKAHESVDDLTMGSVETRVSLFFLDNKLFFLKQQNIFASRDFEVSAVKAAISFVMTL